MALKEVVVLTVVDQALQASAAFLTKAQATTNNSVGKLAYQYGATLVKALDGIAQSGLTAAKAEYQSQLNAEATFTTYISNLPPIT
jgi:hypothetical protein